MRVNPELPLSAVSILLASLIWTAECEECATAQTARAESYIETASLLLDKLKDNLPQDGDCSCPPQPLDCAELTVCGRNSSGVYDVWPRNRVLHGSVAVYCDLEGDGGGWTVIQRRGDFQRPADFFHKSWHQYKTGFGDLRRDFWLGNDIIYALTNQKKYYLRVEMEDFENASRYAFYDHFWVDGEGQHYKLHLHDYSGDAGDSLSQSDDRGFSTPDRDNDGNATEHCARRHKGGWWFGPTTTDGCGRSNLNGMYNGRGGKADDGVAWISWKGRLDSLRATEMKIRPMDFKLDLLDMDIDAV